MTRNTLNWLILGSTLALAGGGCSHDKPAESAKVVHGEAYRDDSIQRDEPRFFDLQIANGARADATLRSVHFDGLCLNSLGKAKVDNMLMNGDACAPFHVFVDLRKDDDLAADRKDAVVAYLKTKGLTEDQIALESGPNLKYGYPAAPGVKALDALDSGAGGFSTGDTSPSNGSAAAH